MSYTAGQTPDEGLGAYEGSSGAASTPQTTNQARTQPRLANGNNTTTTQSASQPQQTNLPSNPQPSHNELNTETRNATHTNRNPPQPQRQQTILDYFTAAPRQTRTPHEDHANAPTNDPSQHPPPKKLRTKANIKIASLNIRGGGSAATSYKWNHINQLMRERKIGILTIQESHLSKDDVNTFNRTFGERLILINSSDRYTQNARGVAIVVNRRIVRIKRNHIKCHEIVAGRALQFSIPWKNNQSTLNILAVYAPNRANENEAFWKTIQNAYEGPSPLPEPQFVLGDFNLVEDPLDRLPIRPDRDNQVNALQSLKTRLQLVDGWRLENPQRAAYTWSQKSITPNENTQLSKSRIDRIYTHRDLFPRTNDWTITVDHPIETDHELIAVTYYDTESPYIGNGRWEMPNFLLDHTEFMEKVSELCNTALEKAQKNALNRSTLDNPQLTFQDLKKDIVNHAKSISKKTIPKARKEISKLKLTLDHTLNDETTDEVTKATLAHNIEEDIKTRERKQHDKIRLQTHTKYLLENETLGKVWIQANKEKKPRDTLWGLKDPTNPQSPLITKTKDMAEIAQKYHESLQYKDLPPENENKEATQEVLNNLETRVSEDDKETLEKQLDYTEVREALFSMPNGKASGLDGIPVELWKTLAKAFEKSEKERPNQNTVNTENEENTKPPNVVELLKLTYNDIEQHGISEGSNFAEGWMCPIYKKKDKTDIANYRPITVLNADYKTFTKALTIKLAPIALKLIHPNQAGFMKGRRIDDHTELIKLMIEWCEVEEENGLLVFLDQEKAYDKITHNFLDETLKKFEFPTAFRSTIKQLYTNAHTVIMINGVKSRPYQIVRGVRQGDPLSCLLFNLAIESLAATLRNSQLQGFTINENIDRLITTLFADDTTVYLSSEDEFKDLQTISKHGARPPALNSTSKKQKLSQLAPQSTGKASMNEQPHPTQTKTTTKIPSPET